MKKPLSKFALQTQTCSATSRDRSGGVRGGGGVHFERSVRGGEGEEEEGPLRGVDGDGHDTLSAAAAAAGAVARAAAAKKRALSMLSQRWGAAR
jgi:hypothetical protein